MAHFSQLFDILHEQRAAATLDDTDPRQAIELAGHGFAMRADPARDLDMRRRRDNARALALVRPQARQPQQLGLDAVFDREDAELVDPRG